MPASNPPAAGVRVAGIGASAGGLEACRKFLAALPAASGIAFILVQHLDPTHESMMVELLANDTAMPVVQAVDGMAVAADHLYVIPPGTYLALAAGTLRLSVPLARHGARLPFDFFLHSLADCGPRAIAIVLSGTGADGALGCQAIRGAGGLVIAQDPAEAAYDGMPLSAIATGAVDLVLPVEQMAAALLDNTRRPPAAAPAGLARIVALLRAKTVHDFTLYKPGTLERRIARRMTLAGIAVNDTAGYLAILERDAAERDNLADDLLINVTRFFRDPKVFDILAQIVIPELVGSAADQPIRVWIAGCSTGEETYSLAMLFKEAIAATGGSTRLQLFASDVDPRAIASARDGLYPFTIEADVTPARLARFFMKEDHGYRISQDVRASVVFAVQDVLADPPFSKLDLISCRNLLIYLRPEAQAKIIAIFNFALRKNAFLLLGSAETVGGNDPRFVMVSKPARLYRKIMQGAAADLRAFVSEGDPARNLLRHAGGRPATRGQDIAEICRKLLLENFAPAAILINTRLECLYSIGPTAPYLRVAPGYPTTNILAMMNPTLRARAKAAIETASTGNGRVVMPGGRVTREGIARPFDIDIRPVAGEADRLLLLCFIDRPAKQPEAAAALPAPARVAMLEQELEETRAELQDAVRGLELSAEEQNAINEEALSVSEEYQSTNEELLTSKEELQSLNEELTALNSQLQETLERSRQTSNDLQNILFSTDVATVFLDTGLNIRFFTPATRALFNIIQSDVGRPLADFRSLAADHQLAPDAAGVLADHRPVEREIETQAGVWFNRCILPYRTHDQAVAGVVITFTDITERKRINAALAAAQRESERANVAKSRFLAAASHDLRQPLQTLALLSGLLNKTSAAPPVRDLFARLDETTVSMAAMLDTLLDINQLDAGILTPKVIGFPVGALMRKLHDEFKFMACDRDLALRLVPCGLRVVTDPALLEQMLRNLLSNALKYTKTGRVLLGARRRGGYLSLQVCDTGIGIPTAELEAIFDEFHQLDNPTRERTHGLGLGLSIVQRLGQLLDLQVNVRSTPRRGSIFSINVPTETPLPTPPPTPLPTPPPTHAINAPDPAIPAIFIVDDDPAVAIALSAALASEDWLVKNFSSAETFLAAYHPGDPGCLLVDADLPGMTGLALLRHLAETGDRLPAIMITGKGDVQMAVAAMQAGALDFLEKPASAAALRAGVVSALERGHNAVQRTNAQNDAARHIAALTARQRQIMELVLAGHPSKNIAADLNISQRTVENHRASIMAKTGAKSLPALARMALAANQM